VKRNIKVVMPRPRVTVGASFFVRGRHRSRCDKKYAIPLNRLVSDCACQTARSHDCDVGRAEGLHVEDIDMHQNEQP